MLVSHTGINLIIDDKLDSDFRKKSVIMQQTSVPMFRSEVQLPGFIEDEAMIPIEVFISVAIRIVYEVLGFAKRNKCHAACGDRANV